MDAKPYHKMPASSWMIPGGNRDEKRKLMKAKKYPMMSAIQKNLGGPLSEVFFSCLSPHQQDQVGYTPRLQGPGRDLWVSPSDMLEGKVVLTPPYTNHLRQALTHQGIMEMGAEIEARVQKNNREEVEFLLREKEREMAIRADLLVTESVQADREARQLINDHILEKASTDLTNSFQEVLAASVAQVMAEGSRRLEQAVDQTRREMEQELWHAVKSRTDYLNKQFEFRLAWRESDLTEKYESLLKKYSQNCTAAMEKKQKEFASDLKKTTAKLEAEHVTDLIMQACEKSQNYHSEKKHMQHSFGSWFTKYFDNEVVQRDFNILELEDRVRTLSAKCARREKQIQEVFEHFQKFINFALKEKPGQAEFLLSLERELKEQTPYEEEAEEEVEFMARMIIEYIMKMIDDNSKQSKTLKQEEVELSTDFTNENFRDLIQQDKENLRRLQLVGEEFTTTQTEAKFRYNESKSLAKLFEKNPSILPLMYNTMLKKDTFTGR